MDWKNEALKLVVPWLIITIVLPALTYIIGYLKDRWHLPPSITKFLGDPEVMAIIQNAVNKAASLADMSQVEKREAVRKAVQKHADEVFGVTVPDSAVNFLIEKVIQDNKAELSK